MTECTETTLELQRLGRRDVVAHFDGGKVTSDAGGLLLRELENRFGFVRRLSECFTDFRSPDRTRHSVEELLRQRIFALCLGYEDLNDHDSLRNDPLLAVLVGKAEPDEPEALAGKSTLNRLELSPANSSASHRYKKISANLHRMQDFLVDAFLLQHTTPPKEIVLDVDSTDDPIHGHQLGRFFHGYHDNYCYLPLYIFSGDHPLLALLRPSNIDEPVGLLKHLARIVATIRKAWPEVKILLRGDAGFCREHVLCWCEANDVDYVIGLAKNSRLLSMIDGELAAAKDEFKRTDKPARVFKDLQYQTLSSWSRSRRVVGKAEHLHKGSNPRFVVTSLAPSDEQGGMSARALYEDLYCARGNMENRIKEQQLGLFADRTSCQTMRANQLRLLFSTVAYILLRALREFGLSDTPLSHARVDTIRLRLLKIGAIVRVTVRKVWIAMSESCPWQETFRLALQALARLPKMSLVREAIPAPAPPPS